MKRVSWKKALAFTLALALVLAGTLFPAPKRTVSAAAKVTLKLKKTTVSVKKGSKVTLKLTKKNVKKISSQKWTTSNKSVATVSSKGVVTGKKAGKATITAKIKYVAKGAKKAKKKTLKAKVTVKDTAAPAPAASPSIKISMKVPETASNVGTEREVSIAGASKMSTDGKMKVKDNGSMRKDLSSQQMLATEMGLGINLGNTMEATKAIGEIDNYTEATDFETAWSQPVTTQSYIDAVHSYGFNTLRVPVSWTSMVSRDGNYTINDKMLGRVEEIVNYALNDGMYVIINDHFDYGWWGAFGSWKYDTDGTTKIPDEERRAEAMKRYKSYWTQISERFKGYSDHLIFESANEELDITIANGGFNAPINEDGYMSSDGKAGILTSDEAYELANEINQEFVNVIRESGGNNASRHLLIAGYNTNIDETSDERWQMPEDTEENGNTKLMVSVHYYTPWDFCGDDMSGADYDEADKQTTITQFDKMKKFTDEGYGVIVGEMGVCNPRQNKVTDWLKDSTEIMTERGCQPVLWENGNYFDREGCIMKYKNVAELYNSLTGSNGKTDGITENAEEPENASEIVAIADDAVPVWSWTGRWKKNGGDNIGLDGSVVTAGDISKFVETDSCTDESKNTFNSWGYQTFLNLDWADIKKPCIKVTFETESKESVGDIHLAATSKADGNVKGEEVYSYTDWAGKAIIISDALLELLRGDRPYLSVSFGYEPTVTGIYIYDLG